MIEENGIFPCSNFDRLHNTLIGLLPGSSTHTVFYYPDNLLNFSPLKTFLLIYLSHPLCFVSSFVLLFKVMFRCMCCSRSGVDSPGRWVRGGPEVVSSTKAVHVLNC